MRRYGVCSEAGFRSKALRAFVQGRYGDSF